MRTFAKLLSLLGLVCGVFVTGMAAMAVASSLISSPVDVTPRMSADSGALWTSVPVRVDPKRQPYEREPDRYPFKFSAGSSLKVLDNATFSLKGDTFVIAGVSRIDSRALCVDELGRRLACGQNAVGVLRTVLRRSFIECSRKALAPKLFMVSCRRDGRDIADLLNDVLKPPLVASVK